MSQKFLIIISISVIVIIAFAVGFYFVFPNFLPSSLNGNLNNPSENLIGQQTNKKPNPNLVAPGGEEALKQEFPDYIEGIITMSEDTIIDNIGIHDRILSVVYIKTQDGTDYSVIGYDPYDYELAGIKDGQKVKAYGEFWDKSKNIFLAEGVVAE